MSVTPAQQASDLCCDARAALGRLRRMWPMLADARLPGRPGAHTLVQRAMSVSAERAEAEHARRDRRAKALALRDGLNPTGPQQAPARLGALGARARVAAQVRAVADRLAGDGPAAVLLRDPSIDGPQAVQQCPWCGGAGVALRPDGWVWAWPDDPPSCGLCGGHGRRCNGCLRVGRPCHCELTDTVVAACLNLTGDRLAPPGVACPDTAAWAAAALNGAANLAATALGMTDIDLRIIKAPCPACDRRELFADVASPEPDEWSVQCRSLLCRCNGPGCGCGRPIRWLGRVHRWPAREFPELADRLGVQLPGVAGFREALQPTGGVLLLRGGSGRS